MRKLFCTLLKPSGILSNNWTTSAMYQPLVNRIRRRRGMMTLFIFTSALLWLVLRISAAVTQLGWGVLLSRGLFLNMRLPLHGGVPKRNRCAADEFRSVASFSRSSHGTVTVLDRNRLVLMTIVDGIQDMPALRNFVGVRAGRNIWEYHLAVPLRLSHTLPSCMIYFTNNNPFNCHNSLHKFRDPISNVVPHIIVYGLNLGSRQHEEITLWSGVEFYDANSILLPAGAVREGDVEFTLHISSLEPEQLYVFRLTLLDIVCRRFGSCVFLDVNQHFRSREPLTTIYETLVEFEHVLGCENTVPRNGTSQMLFACHLLGFTFRSTAYEILVERHLFWFRHKLCDYDWIREKLDSYSIDGANIKSLVELLEIDVVDSLKNQFCFISLREDILYNYQFLIGQQTTLLPVPDGKLRIGLGVPTTGINSKSVEDSSMVAAFLPSFFKSITDAEWDKFEFVLYIAFDKGDPLWDDNYLFAALNGHMQRMGASVRPLVVKYVRMPSTNGWLTYIWNYLYALAINDNCEYFYQLNDDLIFATAEWASQLTETLDSMDGYGVVGPNDLSHDCNILTQSMVTRTHWDIFGWLYPPEIKDWNSDLWLSKVYGNSTRCLQSVYIRNLRNKGERYQKCSTPLWTQSLQRGEKTITEWQDKQKLS